ncbi:hypothetical protein H9Y13_18600 [Aeromonas veronii]|uniref:hypothetical protein n=1 Tax=Aeromonas TaxID=642 RepID=UPI0022EAAD61|nr:MULTISPECIES: hypothetical protein [Aeromonas]KAJ8740024.1 hypothetical protein H9Y13_18600 [Aeromonas veronii]MDA3317840.1 hypothetical protein [Aeromonas sp. PI_26]
MNAAEKALSEIHALFEHERTMVPRCWADLEQCQREAICFTAQLPISLAKPEFPAGRGDRESLRLAAARLDYHDKFLGRMGSKDWRDAQMPPEEKAKGGEAEPVDELARKRKVLKEALSANSGQEKTQVTGAANA